MTYGFKLYNANNQLVASDTDFGYGLVASGSLTTALNAWYTGTVTFTDIGTTGAPLVFVRMNNVSANLWVGLYNTTSTSAVFNTYGPVVSTYNRRPSVAGTFDYRIYAPFKNLPNVSGQTYGMQLYNSSVEKTFDTNYAIPLVSNTVTITVPTPSNSNPSIVASALIPSGTSSNPWVNLSMIAGNGTIFNQGIHYAVTQPTNNASIERCINIFGGYINFSYGVTLSPTQFSTGTWAAGAGQPRVFYLMN